MDYEDFIEGIKPMHSGGNVTYQIEDGIFKQLCIAAKVASEVAASGTDNLMAGLNDNPTIWKVSLEGTGDNPTRRDCMENGHIRIGWAEYGDLDFTEINPEVKEGKQILRAFQNDMKVGDIIVSCWSQTETDAIGIVTGDYEYHPEGGNFPRYRDVRWIVKGIEHDITAINNGRKMTLGTVYRLSTSLNDIIDVIKQHAPAQKSLVDNVEKPFVLIIDEINRGNVSKIFGELITLIERDKRIGENHPVTLTLPYSKQSDFGVPANLYIIGTMNTTDRSTGTIDYALRRRFAFLTVPSRKEVIDNSKGKLLFESVRLFIDKYRFADMDIEDLMVGHSYFMADDDDELLLKVRYEIIPLIKEYVKDGILRVNREEQNRFFSAWLNLEAPDDNDSGTSED
ncbi:MAG: AAA family ATPase [Muribaculaceae bacterium]|nr:AAA family ATPase [Muribaculaceae bacterium]